MKTYYYEIDESLNPQIIKTDKDFDDFKKLTKKQFVEKVCAKLKEVYIASPNTFESKEQLQNDLISLYGDNIKIKDFDDGIDGIITSLEKDKKTHKSKVDKVFSKLNISREEFDLILNGR